MEPILQVKDLSYVYSAGTPFEHKALDNVNFTLNRGEFVGIIGHTGSGKSTLMQQLNGLLKPTSGQVLLGGVDIWSDKQFTRQARFRVGLVFQYPEHQLFEVDVISDVCFGPKNQGLSEEEAKARAAEALRLTGISEEMFHQSPFDLSGGQKRRVAIVGVLAMEPEVLILDEPTAGLDPRGRDEILGLISQLHEKRHITCVLVSHSMEDVARYVERIIVMNRGEVMYDGTPKEVFSHYKELEEIGLAAPQVTYVMNRLKEKGLDVRTDETKVEEARDEILRALAAGGRV